MEIPVQYPQWYRSLRAFLTGALFGAGVLFWLEHAEMRFASGPFGFLSLYMIQALFAIVIGGFEIGFGIQRYRLTVKNMDARGAQWLKIKTN